MLIFSCDNNDSKWHANGTNEISDADLKEYFIAFESINNQEEETVGVFVNIDGIKYRLESIDGEGMKKISTEEYVAFNIPSNAIEAIKIFGDFFETIYYVEALDNEISIRKSEFLDGYSTALEYEELTKISKTPCEVDSNEVRIGNQIWQDNNLGVKTFQNGDVIPQASNPEEWIKAGKNADPAWCYYEFDSSNSKDYGIFYNWYAIYDPRGLAPLGYHIPTARELTNLLYYLGDTNNALLTGTDIFDFGPKKTALDSLTLIKFHPVSAGLCDHEGSFLNQEQMAYYWSSTFGPSRDAEMLAINSEMITWKWRFFRGSGMTVKCLKNCSYQGERNNDLLKKIASNFSKEVSNNECNTPEITAVTIGKQTWSGENLNVNCFSNGEEISYCNTLESWEYAAIKQQAAWCYANFDETNSKYGKLYNWWAVNDSRGLAPIGWHVPTIDAWKELESFLGEDMAAFKIKNPSFWESGSNETGFNCLPDASGDEVCFWSSTEALADNAKYVVVSNKRNKLGFHFGFEKSQGLAVRIVKN